MTPRHTLAPPRPIAPAIGFALFFTGVLLANPALAYVGPGAGLTAIGTVLALVAALALAIVGFVWYPIKRMRRRRKDGTTNQIETGQIETGRIENEASEQR